MNCEDCREWIEEYIDGEADERNKSRLDAHLSACVSCNAAYQELVSEQQFLVNNYQPGVSVSANAWSNVWSGYRRAVLPASATFLGRLSNFGFPGLRFAGLQPAFAIAAIIIVLVGGAYFLSRVGSIPNKGIDVASKENLNIATTGDATPVSAPGSGRENEQQQQGAQGTQAADTEASSGSKHTRQVRVPSAGRRLSEPTDLVVTAKPFDSDNSPVNVRAIRHIENVQLVLRSFRNQSAGAGDEELDVSYANQLSKRLLHANKELQREMKDKGDLRSETVLSSVAPFLSEIAALPDRVSRAEAQRIEQHLQREGVVAALPVFATASLAGDSGAFNR